MVVDDIERFRVAFLVLVQPRDDFVGRGREMRVQQVDQGGARPVGIRAAQKVGDLFRVAGFCRAPTTASAAKTNVFMSQDVSNIPDGANRLPNAQTAPRVL